EKHLKKRNKMDKKVYNLSNDELGWMMIVEIDFGYKLPGNNPTQPSTMQGIMAMGINAISPYYLRALLGSRWTPQDVFIIALGNRIYDLHCRGKSKEEILQEFYEAEEWMPIDGSAGIKLIDFRR